MKENFHAYFPIGCWKNSCEIILFHEIGKNCVYIGWWLQNVLGRKMMIFFGIKKIQAWKYFPFRNPLSNGVPVEWSGHFTFLLLVKDWDFAGEVNQTTEGWLAKEFVGLGTTALVTALLVHGNGERWTPAQTEITEVASYPTLHLGDMWTH